MFETKIFAERLKRARGQKQLSQAELAKAVGVSAATISSYETPNNTKIPSLDKAIAIAEHLGVSLDYLSGSSKEGIEPNTAELLLSLAVVMRYLNPIITVTPDKIIKLKTITLTTTNSILSDFVEDFKKIIPLLDDDAFPEYIRNSLLNPIIEKYKNYSIDELRNEFPF